MSEEHPRYDDKGENFYYVQEDDLVELSQQRSWSWNVLRPNAVIGCTTGGQFSYVVYSVTSNQLC